MLKSVFERPNLTSKFGFGQIRFTYVCSVVGCCTGDIDRGNSSGGDRTKQYRR